MKKLIALSMINIFINLSSALAENKFANVNYGNISVSGSAQISYTPIGAPSYYYNLSGSSQYFVKDQLAVGGTFNFSNGTAMAGLFSVGPELTYYFLFQERVGFYLEEDALYSASYTPTPFWTSVTKVGMNYFITPSVAFGPVLEYFHQFSTATFEGSDDIGLLGAFSLYLP